MIFALIILSLFLCIFPQKQEGKKKSMNLRSLSLQSPNGIIQMNKSMFNIYAQTFPRPYDLVIYLGKKGYHLSKYLIFTSYLFKEFQYLAQLYIKSGCLYPKIQNGKLHSAVYFVNINYNQDTKEIFQDFLQIKRIPSILVSKPKMAVLNQIQKKKHILEHNWQISYSDGHVTTHKMLQFTNKRTTRNILYKPTILTILLSVITFILIVFIGYHLIITYFNFFTNKYVWIIVTLLIYFVCTSGLFYYIIQDSPFINYGQDGSVIIFSQGNRTQHGAQGFIVSFLGKSYQIVCIFGLSLILFVNMHKFTNTRYYQLLFSILILFVCIFVVKFLEYQYSAKSWYNPMFHPPDDYRIGSIMSDQGNMI